MQTETSTSRTAASPASLLTAPLPDSQSHAELLACLFEPDIIVKQMSGRPRNICKEVQALELRAAGESQSVVAQKLGVSVRTVARFEQRWRRGDRPQEEVLAALWSAYDVEQHAWRRVRLLQSMAKVALARAEEAKAALEDNPLPPRPDPHLVEPGAAWRREVAPEVVDTALKMVEHARRSR